MPCAMTIKHNMYNYYAVEYYRNAIELILRSPYIALESK